MASNSKCICMGPYWDPSLGTYTTGSPWDPLVSSGLLIRFKLLVLTFKALNCLRPTYLWDCLSWQVLEVLVWETSGHPQPPRARHFLPWPPPGRMLCQDNIYWLQESLLFHRVCKAGLFHQVFGWGQRQLHNLALFLLIPSLLSPLHHSRLESGAPEYCFLPFLN